jgi:hypothetical protein
MLREFERAGSELTPGLPRRVSFQGQCRQQRHQPQSLFYRPGLGAPVADSVRRATGKRRLHSAAKRTDAQEKLTLFTYETVWSNSGNRISSYIPSYRIS